MFNLTPYYIFGCRSQSCSSSNAEEKGLTEMIKRVSKSATHTPLKHGTIQLPVLRHVPYSCRQACHHHHIVYVGYQRKINTKGSQIPQINTKYGIMNPIIFTENEYVTTIDSICSREQQRLFPLLN